MELTVTYIIFVSIAPTSLCNSV